MGIMLSALLLNLPDYKSSPTNHSLQCGPYAIVAKIQVVKTNMPPELPQLGECKTIRLRRLRPSIAIQEGCAIWSDKQSLPALNAHTACRLIEHVNHVVSRHSHQVCRVDFKILAVEQPPRWAIGLPPQCMADNVFLRYPSLHGNSSALVVDAEQNCRRDIEYEPDGNPKPSRSLGHVDNGQQQGYRGQQESRLLVGKA